MSDTYNITFNKGDSYTLYATISIQLPDDCVGSACSIVPLNLDEYDLVAQIKQSYNSCEINAQFEISYDEALLGKVKLYLSPDETDKLKAGRELYWDLRASNKTNTKAYTPFKGTVTILPTVSK